MRCLETLDTPLGTLQIEATERGLCGIWFPSRSINQGRPPGKTGSFPGQAELNAYFAGDLTTFSVPLDWQGTRFQESVWQALRSTLRQDGDLRRCCQSYRQTALVSARRRCSGKNPFPSSCPVTASSAVTAALRGLRADSISRSGCWNLKATASTDYHAFKSGMMASFRRSIDSFKRSSLSSIAAPGAGFARSRLELNNLLIQRTVLCLHQRQPLSRSELLVGG